MKKFHAVMIDETRCEFGVDFEAANREEAYAWLDENYPESKCDQLEDEEDTRAREDRLMRWAERCADDPYYEMDHMHEWGDD